MPLLISISMILLDFIKQNSMVFGFSVVWPLQCTWEFTSFLLTSFSLVPCDCLSFVTGLWVSPRGDLMACFGRSGICLEMPLHKVWFHGSCFRSSGGTHGAGSCRWPVSCLSWRSICRRGDEASPGLGTAGKETSRETAGSRVEIEDFNRALDWSPLQIVGLSWILWGSKSLLASSLSLFLDKAACLWGWRKIVFAEMAGCLVRFFFLPSKVAAACKGMCDPVGVPGNSALRGTRIHPSTDSDRSLPL